MLAGTLWLPVANPPSFAHASAACGVVRNLTNARIAGVSWPAMLRRVLVPMLRPGLAGAWGLTFVLCLRDLDLAMTGHPPGVETLPIRVYTLMANSPGAVTAALALLMVALTVAVTLVAAVGVVAARRMSAWS